ncbi:MAG: GDP-mannose 4,6-dehydratase [Promethearchaeota archaeon]
MTRVLITGGCGFIGSNLTEFLLEKTDWDINVLDNLSTGKLEDITSLKDYRERVNFFNGDITNVNDITKSIKYCQYVINLAAHTSIIESLHDPLFDQKVNILGLLKLLKLSVEFKIKKFIQASSAAVLGAQIMPINEQNVPLPESPYGASKLAGEGYCSAFHGSYGLRCVVLRFSNVYGPKSYNKSSVIPKYIKRILNGKELEVFGDGNQTRDFIHVKDICQGIFLSCMKNTNGFNIFQLGTGIETSIKILIEELKNIVKKKHINMVDIKYFDEKKGEIKYSYSDISKAKERLGFFNHYNLKSGMLETFEWFMNYK